MSPSGNFNCRWPVILIVANHRCIIDTFVSDGQPWLAGSRPPLPYIEFYERDELAGQLDNWCGPTVTAVESLVRAAGFASAEVLRVTDTTAIIAAHRKWRNLPPEQRPAIDLIGLNCHSHRGRCFQSQKEEYIALWCVWASSTPPPLDDVFPEVDSFGVSPISCSLTPDGLLVNFRVPPGLCAGKHQARIKIGTSRWSEPRGFFMNLSAASAAPTIESAQDGVLWHDGRVDWNSGGWLTLWIRGLSAEADPGNTVVEIDGVPHLPETVDPETGQLNVRLRPIIPPGIREVKVSHRGALSSGITITVAGDPPEIHGLETCSGRNLRV